MEEEEKGKQRRTCALKHDMSSSVWLGTAFSHLTQAVAEMRPGDLWVQSTGGWPWFRMVGPECPTLGF